MSSAMGAVMPAATVTGQMLARVSDVAGYRRWSGQVERAGHCLRPVRLTGSALAVNRATGEVRGEYSTATEPGGVLLVACKDRRESVCPPCAATYRADAWHVFAAGLAGREAGQEGSRKQVSATVPASVATHPAVFATFTAPSFGPVHSYRDGSPCRLLRDGARVRRCLHGVSLSCGIRHSPRDRTLGAPLCGACADLVGMVLWNAHVGELWRRTTIYTYRALARLAAVRTGRPVTVRTVRDLVRVSYARVAEGQKRGLVHLHVIARLDGVSPDDPGVIVPPPAWADTGLLGEALREAASRVEVPLPAVDGMMRVACWGGQLDVRPIGGQGGDARKVAGYLAKYATKTVGGGVLDDDAENTEITGNALWSRQRQTVRPGRRRPMPAPAHLRALAATAYRLATHPECGALRLARHAEALGYRGHVTSKSRRYSVTFAALRAARRAWRIATGHRSGTDPWASGDDAGAMDTVVIAEWRMVGLGHATVGDLALAETLAREHRQARQAAQLGLLE